MKTTYDKLHRSITKSFAVFSIAFIVCLFSFMGVTQDDWEAPKEAKLKKNPVATDQVALAEGKKLYEKECLSCHGKKGKGDGPKAEELDKAVKDLGLPKTQNQTDGELFWKINEGKKPMPSTKKTLSETQKWQVVIYIRTFKK
jgi:mono/diheme cytochrome c family protein